MTKQPTVYDPGSAGSVVPSNPQLMDEGELRLRQLLAVFNRNKWLLLVCAVVGFAGARTYAKNAPRVYEATVTLRIDSRQANLPEIFQGMQQGSNLGTDLEVLESRTLVEDMVRRLGLQLKVVEPQVGSRDEILQDVQVTPEADGDVYRLVREGDSSWAMYKGAGGLATRVRTGELLNMGGLTFRLSPEALQHPELHLEVTSFRDKVAEVHEELEASRTSRETDLVTVRYRDSDPGLVWRVPNVVAERFIERSRDARKIEARSQVRFLKEQIDTLSLQLSKAEEALKEFRERARVVSPQVEASSQISRLVQLESERSTLEAERSSLARLMAEVDQKQGRRAPGEPSAYRDLLAFPSLLRSQAASQLLSSLAQVEDQRATLLTRRTEADAEVQLLNARINELEGQLATIARTYLQGLSNQLASLDATAAEFNTELRQLPRKELEFARLERQPAVLKEIYSLLQTRLKEAEIVEASENSSTSIVDPAIRPRFPVQPRERLLMAAGLLGGLLLGFGIAMVREYADRTVRTRADAQAATGLPVMAIIPRIRRRGSRPAVIAKSGPVLGRVAVESRPSSDSSAPPPPPPTARPNVAYTFLTNGQAEPVAEVPAEPAPRPEPTHALARVPEVAMTITGVGSLVAEAYAILQTNIAFSRTQDIVKVLVLTSSLPNEGKTTTAINLALTLCERGLTVCLIDADIRRGQVHAAFDLPRGPGLAEVLQGKAPLDLACRHARVGDYRKLTVLTSGGPVASPPGLVGSVGMRELLTQLREHYDLIVVDTPPVNILTDAALVGAHADGVLLVVRAGSTDIAALGYAMEQLRHVRAPALGVVLNDVDIKRYSAYDGAYRYASYESYVSADTD